MKKISSVIAAATIAASMATTYSLDAASAATTRPSSPAASASMSSAGVLQSGKQQDGFRFVPTGNSRGAHGVNIVINNAASPKQYRFNFNFPSNYSMHLAYDGSVVVDDGTKAVAQIAAPWAKDAKGRSIPTHFKVEGHTVVQTVDFTASTAFPVVADPWWNPFSWHWSKFGRVARSKLKKCGLSAIGAGAGAVGANVAVNVVRNAAGKYLVSIYGGPYGLIGVAAASCVTGAMS